MNWIILTIAGLFEVAFAFCLGKAKEISGNEKYFWYLGFIIVLSISMGLLIKATQTLPIGTAYAVWSGGKCTGRNLFFQGASHPNEAIFPNHAHYIHSRIEGALTLSQPLSNNHPR